LQSDIDSISGINPGNDTPDAADYEIIIVLSGKIKT